MIFYFSGTGNSKWIAEQLAEITGDSCASITDETPNLSGKKTVLGLVFPVYAWGAPEPVVEFAKQCKKERLEFTFGVCTCGAEAGNTMEKLEKVFPMNSCYSIVMPNNYVMGSDLESEDVVREKIQKAKEKLNVIGQQIIKQQTVHEVHHGSLAWLKSSLVHFGFEHFARTTKPFFVTDQCISCGKCAEICPANTITLVDGKPVWGKTCYQCTGCINRCPVGAIQYGKGTQSRTRYYFPEEQK